MIKILVGFIVFDLLLLAGPPRVSALNDQEALGSIVRSALLSDEQKINELAKLLDRRIVSADTVISAKEMDDYGRDAAQLIAAIAYLTHPIKTTPNAPVIRRLLGPGALGGFKNSTQIEKYLFIALGLAGGRPPDEVMLNLVNDVRTPDEILKLALRAMSRTEVPIGAIPRLLQLSRHSRSVIERDDAGGAEPRKVFPIRKEVAECLARLGVGVNKTIAHETPAGWKTRVAVASFAVDKQSLARRLEQWTLSDDESKWRPALESARRLAEPEVADMMRRLRERKDLPENKRKILEGRP